MKAYAIGAIVGFGLLLALGFATAGVVPYPFADKVTP